MRPSQDPQDYLFVCGTPRSGTTAMARLLNYHPDIVLGVERFKRHYSQGELDARLRDLFDKDRFFAFSEEDTNVSVDMAFARRYELQKQKYDSAIYVGDKWPGFYKTFQSLRRTFFACRVIFTLRDPYAVARSWQMRAVNPDDKWQQMNGYKAAVDEWNSSISHVLRSVPMFRDDLIVVPYEALFRRRPAETAAAIFALLHLDPGTEREPWCRNMSAFLRKSAAIASSARDVPDAMRDYVRCNADFDTYRELLDLAVNPE